MRGSTIAIPFGALAAVGLLACTAPAPIDRGQALYRDHCAACHGATGRGDGPLAASLGMQAANLTVLRQDTAGRFPIDDVITQIHGYSGRYLQGGMPEYDRVLESPRVDWTTRDGAVIPTPQSILDIALYLETLQV